MSANSQSAPHLSVEGARPFVVSILAVNKPIYHIMFHTACYAHCHHV